MADNDDLLYDNDDDYDPPEVYRLELDGDWGWWEFSGLGRQYVQVYAFYHVLMMADRGDDYCLDRLEWAFRAFPWRGGWSSVDFFDALVHTVPRKHLPRIRRFEYSSPGFIEISVGLAAVALIIRTVCGAYNAVLSSYRETQKTLRDTRLWKLDVRKAELSVAERELTNKLANDLGAELELQRFERLLRGTSPLSRVKILLALQRRIRDLTKFKDDDQIQF